MPNPGAHRLMTALGVIIELSPIAANMHEGGEMLQPMAVAAIGGMLVTVAVALYLVPVLYTVVTGRVVCSSIDQSLGKVEEAGSEGT